MKRSVLSISFSTFVFGLITTTLIYITLGRLRDVSDGFAIFILVTTPISLLILYGAFIRNTQRTSKMGKFFVQSWPLASLNLLLILYVVSHFGLQSSEEYLFATSSFTTIGILLTTPFVLILKPSKLELFLTRQLEKGTFSSLTFRMLLLSFLILLLSLFLIISYRYYYHYFEPASADSHLCALEEYKSTRPICNPDGETQILWPNYSGNPM